ncbi:actin-related protein 2-like [Camellia sinensis]|uniref:actin-related protein 2-like n=1 Tax=Camellia sinensis TaxID=4442 RepID=UPI001035CF74|nr:actin-related protein 2-like [Camellia sinensis]
MRFQLVGGKDKEYVRYEIEVVNQFFPVDVWTDYKDTLLGNVGMIFQLIGLFENLVLIALCSSLGKHLFSFLFSYNLEKEILDRYLEAVLKGNKDGLKKLRLRIEDPPRRKHMVYLGGAVLAGIMKDAPEFWISREDYLEEVIACLSKCGQA